MPKKSLLSLLLLFPWWPSAAMATPNILLIVADDQDLSLEPAMTKTRQWLIEQEGIDVEKSFVTTPICCPSRSSLHTGLYQHSTRVWNNTVSGNCWGNDWRQGLESNATIAAVIKEHSINNYTTAFFGKYLNQYGKRGQHEVPFGWDHWAGLVGNSRYYNYTLVTNRGDIERHGENYEEDYLTDVITRKALNFLDNNLSKDKSPFFLVLSPPAPHAPFTPAPQYRNHFANFKAPRTPAFNAIGNQTNKKHWLAQNAEPLSPSTVDKLDEVYRDRLRSLMSVDDMVDAVMNRLSLSQVLDDTLVIYTSDHGYHLGTFALALDKRQPYDTDIRVPLYIRPPLNAKRMINALRNRLVLNLDLAPTILEAAGVDPAFFEHMEGISFWQNQEKNNKDVEINNYESLKNEENEDLDKKHYFENKLEDRDSFYVEYSGEYNAAIDANCFNNNDEEDTSNLGVAYCTEKYECRCEDSRNNSYVCVRTWGDKENTLNCVFHDDNHFIEMYDINNDPFQLVNLANQRNYQNVEDRQDYRIDVIA